MMTWNYRIIRKCSGRTTKYYTYAIHEAYYDEKGKITHVTEDGVGPAGQTVAELRRDYNHMKEAFSRPVVDYESVGKK